MSGGADSTALMHALAQLSGPLGFRIEVACVDHGLRAESGAELERVRQSAAALGLAFHGVRLELEPGPGVEAAARDARYAVLERVRAQRGLDFVATAHTASDQAETVLMRLARGSALGGAAGILEVREPVVRPLLFATRADVEAYVTALGLEPTSDPMNDDPGFLRVRVRKTALPALVAAAGPGTERALARFATLAAEDDALLGEEADRAFERASFGDGSLDLVAVRALSLPIRRRVVARLLAAHDLPLDAATVDDAVRALDGRSTATLPRDRLLTCSDDRVRVMPAPARG